MDLILASENMRKSVFDFSTEYSHTILRSVIVRTMHPTPATSVNCGIGYVAISINETFVAYLFVPTKQHTPAYISPPRHRHAFVKILHQRILCIHRETLDDIRDFCRLGTVEDGEESL